MNEPLATYSESQIGLTRHFELYADRVVVTAKKPGRRFKQPVMLADLRPNAMKMWKRHWMFRVGVLLLLVSVFLLFICAVIKSSNPRDIAVIVFLTLGLGLAIGGGAVCVGTFQPVEWTRYQHQLGIVVLLDVARAGPESDQYDEFVEALDLQILAAQRKIV